MIFTPSFSIIQNIFLSGKSGMGATREIAFKATFVVSSSCSWAIPRSLKAGRQTVILNTHAFKENDRENV